MHLLARSNPRLDNLDGTVAYQHRRDVFDTRGTYARNVGFARLRPTEGGEDRVHRVVEAEQEPGHQASGQRDRPALPNLVVKQRDDTAPGREDIAIADRDEAGRVAPQIPLQEQALLNRLRHAHHIDRLARLVGGNSDDRLYRQAQLFDGTHDILGSRDVGHHRLVGRVLARRHLFERGSVDDDIHAPHGGRDGMEIPYVADLERQQLIGVAVDDLVSGDLPMLELEPQIVLLRLVAREHDDLRGPPELARENAAQQHLSE